MGELPDTAESYQQLAECISRMQEVRRNSDDHQALTAFSAHLNSIGFKLDPAKLAAGKQDVAGQDENGDLAFLRDKELLECFIDETGEYLSSIEASVLELEKAPDNSEAVNAIFRAFHTIKGTAGSVSLPEISSLAHSIENLLDEVRSGRISMDADVIELVLGVDDSLKLMVAHVQDVYENGVAYRPATHDGQLALISSVLEKKCGGGQPVPEKPVTPEKDAAGDEPPPSPPAGGQPPDFLKDSDLLSGFISEAFEHLESIELNVLELEQNPNDQEIINNIFRPFHTIKGVSGFLNLMTINKLAHATENLLDDVRNGKLTMNSGIIDIVLGVGDFLRTMIQNLSDVLEKGQEYYQQYDIKEFLARIKICQEGSEAGQGEEPVHVTEAAEPPVQQRQAPQPAEDLSFAEPTSPAAKMVEAVVNAAGPAQKKNIEAAIKVDINKLDGLVNAVGELVIMQAMVQHNPLIAGLSDPKLSKDFSQLTRITTDLQKTAMSMRMVPIRQTFQKMTRLVRDLSKKTGKLVNLVMEGEETEIDRNMVDSIYDPLVHMIRNSVDHGVQLPAERLKRGKPEAGTVKLSAYQKGGNIIIEIVDDGEGVNTEKIRNKALERGLIQAGGSYTDHEINNLIFLAGFSTADKITDVSGRGVGMDVVKKGVETLRGKVELQSTPGEGSLFLMYLPLTLAIIDGIVVRVGFERYIIPTIAIRESMRPRMENYNTVQGKGETLLVRDTLLPIIRLYHVFGVADACTDISQGIVVVVENEGRQRALLVDELLGKQEVVIKSLGGYMKDIKGVAGGTILGDGRVGLILDLAGLISVSEEMGPGRFNRKNAFQE
jgi:two-component system chemotaxis sensor kinase CheA